MAGGTRNWRKTSASGTACTRMDAFACAFFKICLGPPTSPPIPWMTGLWKPISARFSATAAPTTSHVRLLTRLGQKALLASMQRPRQPQSRSRAFVFECVHPPLEARSMKYLCCFELPSSVATMRSWPSWPCHSRRSARGGGVDVTATAAVVQPEEVGLWTTRGCIAALGASAQTPCWRSLEPWNG